jgi:AcrR family transcriptional regulator
VARTTIYRRFRDRDALIAAVLDAAVESRAPSPELPLADKLSWVLGQARDVIESVLGRGGTAAVLADSDPAFTSALRHRLRMRVALLRDDIDADIRAGRVRVGVDAEALAGLALGAYLGEVLQAGQPRDGWMDGFVGLLLPAVTPQGTEPGLDTTQASDPAETH